MNPNAVIRPWLLACGEQYGITEAHEYRRPDDTTRPEAMYCTYQSVEGSEEQYGLLDMTTEGDSNTVHRKGCRDFYQLFRVDLYNSEDGLYELEAFTVAADHSPALKRVFSANGCAYVGLVGAVQNDTRWDGREVYYHFWMTVAFREWVEINLDEVNGIVDQIDLKLDTDSTTVSITDSGIS